METAIAVSAGPLTHPADLAVVATAAATAIGTAPEEEGVVGMAVTVAARAHMMTDLAAEASATATPGSLAATWSPSDRAAAARMVGTAAAVAETTTGPETTTTPGSAASTAATKTPGSCDATNKTGSCLVVGITFFTVVFFVSPIRLVSSRQ
jgi:hypothetical protein